MTGSLAAPEHLNPMPTLRADAASPRRPMSGPPVTRVEATAYTVPTEAPESDGTLEWDATTIVIVEVATGFATGLGYAYTAPAAASVVRDTLAGAVIGADALAPRAAWSRMVRAVRNQGRPGIAASAIAAVDVALWDLRARVLGLSLADAVGRAHDARPVYGSGGFTSESDGELADELTGWVDRGIRAVKMKVGREPLLDSHRVAVARGAIGDDIGLFVDANGAYTRKQALELAHAFAELGVSWFEEPVSSDDLEGLRLVRDGAPPGMDVTAGEYGYDLPYFERMLTAGAVDCLQADVTRCGGVTGFLRVGALADAHCLDLSTHTAPQVSAHAGACVWHLRHLEYFADHVRIESLLFDGVLEPVDGALHPDPGRPGLGIELKRADAERYRHTGGRR
jgi:L-alanine-DL-glutamate epimerase-like enolase superfamily enzyme